MPMHAKVAKAIILAGIPFLAVPFFNESGMAGDRSQRDRSSANYQIVKGEISQKNGDEITLRTSEGDRITFRINDQTNQLCPKGTQASQSSSKGADLSKDESSSMKQGEQGATGMSSSGESSSGQSSANSSSSGHNQTAQKSMGKDSSSAGETSSSSLFGSSSGQASGQDSGQGSTGMQSGSQQSQPGGFKFGDCNFKKGEFVKVKLDDNDDATFVRSMGNSKEYYATGGVEGEYFVLPAGELGGMDVSDKDSGYTVKSSSDEEIGKIYKVMSNSEGDYSYAIIRKTDGQLISVPWQALEGSGKKSFKLNVTQNQLGNLPILEEGESSRQHVQRHWDLTEQEQKRLAKWDDQLDNFYQDRDRNYEDTPTFRGNQKGYDRYDYDQSRTSRTRDNDGGGGMSQRHYQDQSFDDSKVKRYGFSPQEFPPPSRAPQYEGADQQGSSDRNRQGRSSRYDSDNERSQSRINRSRSDNQRRYQDQRSRGSEARNYDQEDSISDRNRRSMYSQSRERDDHRGNRSDRYQTTSPRSEYNPQRNSSDRYQSQADQGDDKDYDYRPEGYR